MLAGVLAGLSIGCKTQEDAVAAASQMAATAAAMGAYYQSMDVVLRRTEDAYEAQQELLGVPPEKLADIRSQIRLREDLAEDVAQVAGAFQQLNGSTAPGDAASAAGKLNEELVSVKAIAGNDAQTKALTVAVKALVTLLQQHEEIKAAKQLSPLCHELSTFFDSEARMYDSLNTAYLLTAKSVATALVEKDDVKSNWIFDSALRPFELEATDKAGGNANARKAYLSHVIEARYTDRLAAATKATQALSDSLKEMDRRVALVSSDKPMKVRMAPVSLADVESWMASLKQEK